MDAHEKIAQLEKLLEVDPDATGFFMLGKLYLDVKMFPEAAATLEKAIEHDPEYSAAWKLQGDAWRKAGENGKAIDTYRKGIEVATARGDLQTVKEMNVFLKKLEEA